MITVIIFSQLAGVSATQRLIGHAAAVRLATFNILHGRSLVDGRVDVARFAAAIAALDADVLGLQEVDRNQPRSQGADLTAVAAEAMGAIEHRFVAALSGTPGGTWSAATGDEQPGAALYGVALLSRLPVRAWEVVRLPALPARVPVKLPSRRTPTLVKDEPRVAVVATLDAGAGSMVVATTHLSFVPRWNQVQLRRLRRSLRHHDGPVVLLGDLNMGTEPATRLTGMRALATGLTFPAVQPRVQIDHVLARGLESASASAKVHSLPLSDHCALTVDL